MIAQNTKVMILFAATLVSAGGLFSSCCKRKKLEKGTLGEKATLVSAEKYKKMRKRRDAMEKKRFNPEFEGNYQATEEDKQNFIDAAAKSEDKVMKKLIQKGVRVNEVIEADEDKWIALHLAVVNEDESTVNFLLENGADVNVKSIVKNADGMNAIHLNALTGNVPIMRSLLKSRDAKIDDIDSKDSTPLTYAKSKGYENIVKMLDEYKTGSGDSNDILNKNSRWIIGKSGESCTKACLNNQLVCEESDFRSELKDFSSKANAKHRDGMEKQLAKVKGMSNATCKREMRCDSTSNYCPAVVDLEGGEYDVVEDILNELDALKTRDFEDVPVELMCLKPAPVKDHSTVECDAETPPDQHRMCYCSQERSEVQFPMNEKN